MIAAVNWSCLLVQETLLLEPMFEVPCSDITTVILTEDVVKGKNEPFYIRSPREIDNEAEEDSGYEEEERMQQHWPVLTFSVGLVAFLF